MPFRQSLPRGLEVAGCGNKVPVGRGRTAACCDKYFRYDPWPDHIGLVPNADISAAAYRPRKSFPGRQVLMILVARVIH